MHLAYNNVNFIYIYLIFKQFAVQKEGTLMMKCIIIVLI